jgi:hypothetical protein
MKVTDFRDVTPCSLVRYVATFLRNLSFETSSNYSEDEGIDSSESSVPFCQTTRNHIAEVSNL